MTVDHRDIASSDARADPGAGPGQISPTKLLEHISRAQRDFILDGDAREVFSRLLDGILDITASEYGFIGETEPGDDGRPVLRTWAITNIAWTDELAQWFEKNNPNGLMFEKLETLFGAVLTEGEPVIANEPGTDSRRGGLPEGHPPLLAFLGLPFLLGGEVVGMVGLANRVGGYNSELVEQLEPFAATCVSLIGALRAGRERDMANSERRQRIAETATVLESVADAVVVVDELGVIRTYNRAAETTFGYSAKEAIGQRITLLMPDELIPPPDVLADHDRLRRYVERGVQPFLGMRQEVFARRKDGTVFPMELIVSEVVSPDATMFVGTCRDLTSRHLAATELQMYAGTIEATPDFVGVGTADGTVLAINEAGRRLIGFPLDEPIMNLQIGDVHTDASRRLVVEVGLPTALRQGSWSGETEFRRPSGGVIPMSQVIMVSRDAHGHPRYVSTIARDISEAKEVERLKTEFVSTVSHELRTPLTSIRGSLGLLTGGVAGQLPEQAASMIQLALSSTERLIRLVNDILDLEKAETQRLGFEMRQLRPGELVNATIDAIAGLSEEADVAVVVEGLNRPVADATFLGDIDRLVQLLVNLIANAIKFSPPGDTVTVSLSVTPDGTLRISVSDNGCGIDETHLETVFEPFRQIDSSDRRRVGGTGLGLAIVRAIAEGHHGSVTVRSTVGVGSTFTVRLPTIDPRESGDHEAAAARPDTRLHASP